MDERTAGTTPLPYAEAYLDCPECGVKAVPNDAVYCPRCDPDARHDPRECWAVVTPLWSPGDRGPCRGCDVALRVVVDGEGAHVEVSP